MFLFKFKQVIYLIYIFIVPAFGASGASGGVEKSPFVFGQPGMYNEFIFNSTDLLQWIYTSMDIKLNILVVRNILILSSQNISR